MKMIAPMMQIALILVQEHMIVYVTTVSKAMVLFVQILTTVKALHVVTTLHVLILEYLLTNAHVVMDILVVELILPVRLTTMMTASRIFVVSRVTIYVLMKVYSASHVYVKTDILVVVPMHHVQLTMKMTVWRLIVQMVPHVSMMVYYRMHALVWTVTVDPYVILTLMNVRSIHASMARLVWMALQTSHVYVYRDTMARPVNQTSMNVSHRRV
jgi:hypothetical protein